MKLKSIEIQNYRSIVKTTRLQLDPGLTVILGPNNEGKSNLLRAIVLAMDCLKAIRLPLSSRTKGEALLFRAPRNSFDWETDFPLGLQHKQPDGETMLALEFELSPDEQGRFRKEIGSSINQSLPLEITIGTHGEGHIRVRKQGRAAKSLETKSRKIAGFVSGRFEFQYIPSFRPSQLSLEVVGNLIERELEILSSNLDYQNALKTIEDLQKPVFERLAVDVQTYLKKLLPTVKSVTIGSTSLGSYRPRFRTPQFIVDDGTATELEAKGDGVKSLAAISLMRATRVGDDTVDLVVAIEEPESHLHPEAIRQLAIVLREMAKEHQVIISTHSPLLVARNRMEANIIVSKSRAVPANDIGAVRESLGVKIADNLQSAEYVVVVEGETDVRIISTLFKSLSPAFKRICEEGKVVFDHLHGTGNIAYMITTLRQSVATPLLVVDDDKAGRECAKKAKSDGKLEEQYIFCCSRSNAANSELEDFVDPDCYWAHVEKLFGGKFDQEAFRDATDKWSDRMRGCFRKAGKIWDSSTESNLKKAIVESVESDPVSALTGDARELFMSIAEAIIAIIECYEL